MTRTRILVLAGFLVALAAFFATGAHEALTFENLKANQEELQAFYRARPALVASAFFIAYIALATASLPGGAALTMIAGALFGVLPGTILVSFASTIGATFAMLISRFALRDWVERRFGGRVAALNRGVEREGALYLFMLRLVPAIPFLLVNVGMGLTRLPATTYYWVSQLGMLPGSFLFANAGRALGEMDSPEDVFSPGIVTAFILLGVVPILLKKTVEWLRRQAKERSGPAP